MKLLRPLAAAAALAAAGTYAMTKLVFGKGEVKDFTTSASSENSPYTIYRDTLMAGVAYINALDFESVCITADDGVSLMGKLYRAENERALAILFHGYHSVARNDFCCAFRFFLENGISILLIDERAHGESGGKYISLGALERYDCLRWAEYAAARLPSLPIILDGISMGAATVLMASDLPLPPNVRGIVADCGYTSAPEIIRRELKKRGIPAALVWPLIRAGAVIWAGFDPDTASAEVSLSRTKLPVLLIHGVEDGFVPCYMSYRNYDACAGEKTLVTVPYATHGFSYVLEPERVSQAMKQFLTASCGIPLN